MYIVNSVSDKQYINEVISLSKIEELAAACEELMSGNHGKMSGNHGNMIEKMSSSTKGELFILKYLYYKSEAVIPSEISEKMHISTARISAALGSLEKKGQIHREIDTTNRRNILVTITEEGRERICSNLQQLREGMISIFTEMGEEDAAEFVRLTKRFLEISRQRFDKIPPDG